MSSQKMKIQLSRERIAPDHMTVWQVAGENVDLTMDLKELTFRPGSLESIVAIHVLDHLFPAEIVPALKNWYDCLAPGGALSIIVDDFEYVARAVVGADISIDMFNQEHSHPTQFSRDTISKALGDAGFKEENFVQWFQPIPDFLPKKHYELLIACKK